MKHKILITFIIAFATIITVNSSAQSRSGRGDGRATPERRYDITEIALLKPDNLAQGLLLGESTAKAAQVLGQPTNITDQYFEMDETTAKVYHYGANKLFFVDGKLSIWELNDNSINVGAINGKVFKIGDPLTKTEVSSRSGAPSYQKTFMEFMFHPEIQKRNEPTPTRGASSKTSFGAWIKNKAINVDSSINLEFNEQDQLAKISITN